MRVIRTVRSISPRHTCHFALLFPLLLLLLLLLLLPKTFLVVSGPALDLIESGAVRLVRRVIAIDRQINKRNS
jgi:hypothetical protein